MKKELFPTQETWSKRDSRLFDVKMGLYDGTEVCELNGNYLFYEPPKLYKKKDKELYRDNRLAVFKNKSGPESEKLKIEKVENKHLV